LSVLKCLTHSHQPACQAGGKAQQPAEEKAAKRPSLLRQQHTALVTNAKPTPNQREPTPTVSHSVETYCAAAWLHGYPGGHLQTQTKIEIVAKSMDPYGSTPRYHPESSSQVTAAQICGNPVKQKNSLKTAKLNGWNQPHSSAHATLTSLRLYRMLTRVCTQASH
jgi:hypothetical protein